ncbi:hypothetical protein K438DRAFT_1779450 [Mycena galopus ATCC 62051]|nr:hypothetical protein K438DRAFT_1779450 [Mycena galopus ATCC 62051]
MALARAVRNFTHPLLSSPHPTVLAPAGLRPAAEAICILVCLCLYIFAPIPATSLIPIPIPVAATSRARSLTPPTTILRRRTEEGGAQAEARFRIGFPTSQFACPKRQARALSETRRDQLRAPEHLGTQSIFSGFKVAQVTMNKSRLTANPSAIAPSMTALPAPATPSAWMTTMTIPASDEGKYK